MELPRIYGLAGFLLAKNGKPPLNAEQRVQLHFMLVSKYTERELLELDQYIESVAQLARQARAEVQDPRAARVAVQLTAAMYFTDQISGLLRLLQNVLLKEEEPTHG